MTPDFDLIRELFDLSPEGLDDGTQDRPRKVGKDEQQSRDYGRKALTEGDYESAIAHFKRAVEQSDDKSPWALMDLGATYATQDNVPQAFRQFLKAKRIQKSGELMIGLAALQQQMGHQSEAIQSLRESVELEPESAYNHYKLAEALRRSGFRAQALDAAQVAVAQAPDQAFYHYWLGEFLLELGNYAEAQNALHAAIELSPGDDNLYFLASQAFWGQGKAQEAIRSIRLASDIETENLMYRGLLEVFLRKSGLSEEADQERDRIAGKMEEYDQASLNRVLRRLKLS